MLDEKTGIFYTSEIGSFYSFESERDEHGLSLIGTARVAKRNRKVVSALMNLFSQGDLNFSFEILVGDERIENGITIIDASENNSLMGAAVVWNPAYVEAKALALVAEVNPEDGVKQIMPATSFYLTSEISLDTIRVWVWEMLVDMLGDMVWEMSVERVCMDCCIIYQELTGRTFKIEFIIEESGLLVTDIFEVMFTRKVGEKEMTDYNATPVAEVTEQPIEAVVEEVATEEITVEETQEVVEEVAKSEEMVEEAVAEETQPEVSEAEEPVAEEEPVVEQASTEEEVEIDAMKNRIKQLEEQNLALERVIASERKEREVAKASVLATKSGLDLNDEAVKSAVDAADFGKIATLVAESEEAVIKQKESSANPFVAELKVAKHSNPMFERG